MDISDKNFRPCPCGYQICQFCYNNIRLNPELNGRCPGCRRLYDDESVEYKSISPEEYKLQQIRKEKREREKKQREKEKKETEMANKKHLAGLRVVQKNLVYVTGLNPPCASEELHSVLRSDKYFGQYGKILKIVINRKNPTSHHQNPGLVVYVTFAKKEDALRCINELDGSLCDGRLLRAAHGTTKYCLSYLRGHPCPNPNCMFLHEPGEEADSYTRKDLSTQQGIKMGMMGMNKGDDNNEEKERMGYSHASTERATSEARESPAPVSAVPAPAPAPAPPVAIAPAPTQPQAPAAASTAGTVLPAAAGWAKAAASALASASGSDTGAVANASAFPTLGEIKEKQQKKDSKLKTRPKKESLGEDYDWDDSPVAVGEDIAARLNLLETSIEKLKVHFADFDNSSTLPLFAFTPPSVGELTLEDDKLAARQIIERYILKPIKNYHLAYQNPPVTQQQALLQQQAQMRQAQPQPTQTMQMAQVQLMEQKKLLEQQQAEQRIHQEQQRQQPLQQLQQQQQQQYLLLQQLQHQQAQQQHQGLQQHQLQQQQARGTSTPPPPGLFAEKQQQQYNAQSSSSQLLTQLMSGKRPIQ